MFKLWELVQRLLPGGTIDPALNERIEEVVELADPTIRRARRYRKVLAQHVPETMAHCLGMLDTVPGPVTLSRKNYHSDHTVRALFRSAEDVGNLLTTSPDMEKLRKSGYTGEAVGLLTMFKREKTTFGHEQHGKLLLSDVAQKTIDFYDHRIIGPSATFASTKYDIQVRGLEVLAMVAMERITHTRNRISELRNKRDYLKGIIRIFQGKAKVHTRFGASDSEISEELNKARVALEQVETELHKELEQLSYPEDALRLLVEILGQPEKFLKAAPYSVLLDWMHVIRSEEFEGAANSVELAEFILGDELKRYAIFVTFHTDEI